MFSEIFIDDYCNFNRFKIDFPNYKNVQKPNLNILVGRNGSGNINRTFNMNIFSPFIFNFR